MKACCLVFTILLAGCAAAQKLTPGSYVETPDTGILWEGHTLAFHADYTFSYNKWSDNLAANEYGAGTYQIRNKVLTLSFEKQLPQHPAQVQTRLLDSGPDSLVFTFSITTNTSGKEDVEPVPYATINALDASGKAIASTYTNEQGQGVLRFARVASPQMLRVALLGWLPYSQPCPASSTAFQVLLEPKRGTFVQAGTTKEYPVISVADSCLIVLWDKRRTRFALRP
jgi:hypothetical protein